jgi:hypothetical protein
MPFSSSRATLRTQDVCPRTADLQHTTMTLSAKDETRRLIRFRRATRADVGNIVSLVDAAYRGEGLGGWTTEAHLVGVRRTDAEAVEEVLAAPGSTLLLAEIDGDLVGLYSADEAEGLRCSGDARSAARTTRPRHRRRDHSRGRANLP